MLDYKFLLCKILTPMSSLIFNKWFFINRIHLFFVISEKLLFKSLSHHQPVEVYKFHTLINTKKRMELYLQNYDVIASNYCIDVFGQNRLSRKQALSNSLYLSSLLAFYPIRENEWHLNKHWV